MVDLRKPGTERGVTAAGKAEVISGNQSKDSVSSGTGMSHDELLDNYPNLTLEHIQAAQQYAADLLAMDQIIYQ